ncbi:MAG: acyl-CoA thioesterase [Alphaproteobacteria bacterium]|nr:acyl-CoA thioesterase [Alphaproteobacteria bacterium]MBU0795215.1 acyl-CoA thioesterase [Alphaproteobacteria bacterium]MBU0876657.1 acyl-CoA thioesterase [Alphaproteobacteria bacterium]MBU1769359.1 acyl-CoA thioesterase [Alphaproteobacteria bacterium]
MPFETTTPVRFAHIDGAGIVFYPRYFEMLNAAVEDWFAQQLGADFRSMHLDRGIGVPTVQLSAEFLAPSMLGEELTIRLAPERIGRSSCTFTIVFVGDGRERLRVNGTLVCMDLKTQTSVPWPADIRERMMQDLVTI